jgi:hypothetical protein
MSKKFEDVKSAARAAALKVADRDHDGDVDVADVRLTARVWEERYPLGAIIVCLIVGAIAGYFARGLIG